MKISVYITNHNYGRYLKRSIESVLNQNFNDFELIIIDQSKNYNLKSLVKKWKGKFEIQYQHSNKK